jgi:hypothetical protein
MGRIVLWFLGRVLCLLGRQLKICLMHYYWLGKTYELREVWR